MTAHALTTAPSAAPSTPVSPEFEVTLARDAEDIRAAQRLRYDVFVAEMGADGATVDHANRQERDGFDAVADHLILRDMTRAVGDRVVGVYRLLTEDAAQSVGGFYSDGEFDLTPLRACGRPLLELGRSCLHRDYRGGAALMQLWQALADYARARNIGLMFGAASFPGTDLERLAAPLSLLHHRHLAPDTLRAKARGTGRFPLLPLDEIDRLQAMRDTPALIKGYLRLGGVIGHGVYVDHSFNTTDVLMILDTATLKTQRTDLYTRKAAPA